MKPVLFVLLLLVSGSCNWAKDKAKDTLHKTGEIVGKTGSEIADGVSEGVEESFSNVVLLSDGVQRKGVTLGRVIITGTDSSSDNILSAYLIFNHSFSGTLTAKAIGTDAKEFGRATQTVAADSGAARFFDFVFDKRTNIDRKDRVVIE